MTLFQDNLIKAQKYLAPYQNGPVPHLINGQDVLSAGGAVFETISPTDLKPLAKISKGGVPEIDQAVAAAKSAFPAWSQISGEARKKILHKLADAIVARAEEIALIECMDTGQSYRFMSKAALRGAENFRYYADLAPTARDGKSFYTPDQMNVTSRFPIGPVGVITPWNTPFMLSTWKIAPALAAGCTVVHKPAEFSPLTARLLAEIARDAGLPAGVLNMVNGFGEDAGKALTEHPDIKAIGFVGETRTGSRIMVQGAPTLKRVHFELGGKNPVIVFADADLERALDAVIFMIYSLNGERCTSSSRLLVERSIYASFTAKLAEKIKQIRVGHPLDPETVIGPLIHPEHERKVLSYIEIGQQEGAKLATGGQKPAALDQGCYVTPALFTDVDHKMRIAQEEIFGPVLSVIPFDREEDAIHMANDVVYGLTGYVWTSDITRALRVSAALQAGMVWVNSENIRHLPTPFGGVKSSGIGRDGGDWSFDFYMETKNTAIALGAHDIPRLGG